MLADCFGSGGHWPLSWSCSLRTDPVPLTCPPSSFFRRSRYRDLRRLLRVQNPQDATTRAWRCPAGRCGFVAIERLPGFRGFAFVSGTSAPRLLGLYARRTVRSLSGPAALQKGLRGFPAYKISRRFFIIGSILAFAACIRRCLVVPSFATIVICRGGRPPRIEVKENADCRNCRDPRLLLRPFSLWLTCRSSLGLGSGNRRNDIMT